MRHSLARKACARGRKLIMVCRRTCGCTLRRSARRCVGCVPEACSGARAACTASGHGVYLRVRQLQPRGRCGVLHRAPPWLPVALLCRSSRSCIRFVRRNSRARRDCICSAATAARASCMNLDSGGCSRSDKRCEIKKTIRLVFKGAEERMLRTCMPKRMAHLRCHRGLQTGRTRCCGVAWRSRGVRQGDQIMKPCKFERQDTTMICRLSLSSRQNARLCPISLADAADSAAVSTEQHS